MPASRNLVRGRWPGRVADAPKVVEQVLRQVHLPVVVYPPLAEPAR